MTVDEIVAEAEKLNPSELSAPSVGPLWNGTLALDDGSRLRRLVSSLLLKKLQRSDCSLAELERLTGVELVVVASDLKTCGVRYMGRNVRGKKNDGHFSAVDAVVASMSVPLLFAPVQKGGNVLVDGVLCDNFPVLLFPAATTVGFSLTFNILGGSIHGVAQYARRLYEVMSLTSEMAAWASLPDAYKSKCIVLSTAGQVAIPNASLHIDEGRRLELIQSGYRETLAALRGERVEGKGDVAHCLPAAIRARRTLPLFYALLARPDLRGLGASLNAGLDARVDASLEAGVDATPVGLAEEVDDGSLIIMMAIVARM